MSSRRSGSLRTWTSVVAVALLLVYDRLRPRDPAPGPLEPKIVQCGLDPGRPRFPVLGCILIASSIWIGFFAWALGPSDPEPLTVSSEILESSIDLSLDRENVDAFAVLELGELDSDVVTLSVAVNRDEFDTSVLIEVTPPLQVRPWAGEGEWSQTLRVPAIWGEKEYRELLQTADSPVRAPRFGAAAPIACIRLPSTYYTTSGPQVRIATPFMRWKTYDLADDTFTPPQGGTAVAIDAWTLKPLRVETSSPSGTFGWWTGDEIGITLYFIGTQPAVEASDRRYLFLSGIAFGVAASAFVGGLQEVATARRTWARTKQK